MRKILVCCLTTIISALFCFSTLEAQSITAVYAPTSVASGGGTDFVGTPFALYVRIQGWTAATNSQAFIEQIGFPGTKRYVQTVLERYAYYRPIFRDGNANLH